MSYAVGHRCGLDLSLLWVWCRLAATALIQPLAWERPYAANAALKRKKKKKYIYIYIYIKQILKKQKKKQNYTGHFIIKECTILL